MNKYILSFALILMATSSRFANAQAPAIQWARCHGGSLADYSACIQLTKDGGYIVAGTTVSPDGDVTGVHGIYYDFWVTKLNSSGNIQWEKCYGSTGSDAVSSIVETSDSGYLVAGQTALADGDVAATLHGGSDTWVLKLDDTGRIQWQKCYGGSKDEWPSTVQQTSDGGFIIAGVTQSNDGDITSFAGVEDGWLIKISSTGTLLWQQTFGGSFVDVFNSVVQTKDGGYICSGTTASALNRQHSGATDAWVVKVDGEGTLQWQKCYGGTGMDAGNDIRQTKDGGYILAANTASTDGDVTFTHGSVWMVKMDDTGRIQWERTYGGSGSEGSVNVLQAADSGYVVLASTTSNDGDVSGNHGANDTWLFKTNNAGTLLWQKCYGGTAGDGANSFQITPDGGFIVGGATLSNNDDVHGLHGSEDEWIVKLTCGTAGSINGHASVCPQATITLSDTVSGGSWSVANNHASVSGGIVTGLTPGLDTVYYTVTNNCGTMHASFVVNVVCNAGVGNIESANSISLYPNPANQTLNITSANKIGQVTISDILGREVLTIMCTSQNIMLDISQLPGGLYFVRIDGNIVKRFVKD